jgi:glycosyltransferase involved in cell wall biosynthesis
MNVGSGSMSDVKSVSVIIASIVGAPFLDDCLMSLEKQAREQGAEVIVVACGDTSFAGRIARAFPWTRVIHRPERESVPDLRRHGLEAARGDVVAIIEEHCLAAPDWLRRVVEAHRGGDCGAVGGPVVDYDYRRLRDWVVYFTEYNGYLPPWREGEAHSLGSANIAYSRAALLKYRDALGDGYWEAALHERMAADGMRFSAAPDMKVYHRGPFNYGYYLRQRYLFSRAFAGARKWPASRRAVYLAASPAAPFLLFARMAKRVLDKRCRVGKFFQAAPLLLPALCVYVAGECVGYLAGPGDALLKVE